MADTPMTSAAARERSGALANANCWSLVSAAIEASRREVDAPPYVTTAQREAWADGYTRACEDIRAAIKEVASDGT